MSSPFDLPVHPAIVHFPIALLTLTWACLVVRYATGDARWAGRARIFEVPGVIALLPTIVAGFVDTRGIGFIANPRLDGPLFWHFVAGIGAAVAFTGHLLWRRRKREADFAGVLAVGDLSLASVGMVALLAAGLIGSEMVHSQ